MTERIAKACVRCRAQKMKCVGGSDPPCRGCRRNGLTCEFMPRSNAAKIETVYLHVTEQWKSSVEARLQSLEEENRRLRLSLDVLAARGDPFPVETLPAIDGVVESIKELKEDLPFRLANSGAWFPENITRLWRSFEMHVPEVHFLSGGLAIPSGRTSPLLTVAVLFTAANHTPDPDLSRYLHIYFEAFGRAVGSLSLHRDSDTDAPLVTRSKFDDVLGIVLAGLLAIGWVDEVGLWINTGYRLFLDGVSEGGGRSPQQWRELWEGLRTIELEHSSLHLGAPALPVDPPEVLQGVAPPSVTAGTDIAALLAIMQRRMRPFVGRGLFTPWDRVRSAQSKMPVQINDSDRDELQGWAAEIDSWYSVHSQKTMNASMYIRAIILLNYHLHKIYVLSLALALTAAGQAETVPVELLVTCRQGLALEMSGFDVWSSWDLVLLTNACLFLIDGMQAGQGQVKDVELVRYHIGRLASFQHPAPSLRHTLAERLRTALRSIDLTSTGSNGVGPSPPGGSNAYQQSATMTGSTADAPSSFTSMPISSSGPTYPIIPDVSTEPTDNQQILDLDALFAPFNQTVDLSAHVDKSFERPEAGDWPSFLNLFGSINQTTQWQGNL